ncbi:nickel ABC transporter substrate-binding protein [Paenibacillus sp. V4I7]|uniref:nickel ABC transporter substrate-binding protein n=1 Tax=Paenibacillus sp. V4I7 TaxID=3042307 RepID=UPI0027803346|nr:nickel ABC transporter substrate-binding protein [Paenibacillus sp. V4I7]MDQ0898897.1 nickel transport system substrate-binding protein [Paenibacillus sp. V4I7]
MFSYIKTKLPSILMLILAISLAACSTSVDKKAGDIDTQKQSETTPKMITMAWNADVGPLNPHLYGPSQVFAQAMVYEPLVDYVEGGKIVPRLAEKWEISDDGLVYTFHLRKDVKYSDGSVFNADNAKKNIDAIIANKQRHSWMGIVTVLDRTEKINDDTIRLILTKPYYPLLQELAFARPFRFLADAGFPSDGKTSEAIVKPIGTGPWVLTEYKKDGYAVFSRNENYWGIKPQLGTVKVLIIPDSETIVTAFEKHEIDLIVGAGIISMDNFKYLRDSGKYNTGASEPLTTRSVILNSAKAPTSEMNVRLAIQHGIDKAKMIQSVTLGLEKKADTIMASNFPYSNIDLKPYAYDPKKSEQLLDEAGWKLPSGKSVREKDGKPLLLDLVYVSTDAIQKPMAEILQAELAKIGVQVQVKGEELMVGNGRLKSGDYHLNFWSTYGVPNDPHNFVTTSTQAKTGIYEALLGLSTKPQIDAQSKEVLASTDEKKRVELYRSILTQIHEGAVFYPTAYESMITVYHKNLTGLKFNATKYDFPFGTLDITTK